MYLKSISSEKVNKIELFNLNYEII